MKKEIAFLLMAFGLNLYSCASSLNECVRKIDKDTKQTVKRTENFEKYKNLADSIKEKEIDLSFQIYKKIPELPNFARIKNLGIDYYITEEGRLLVFTDKSKGEKYLLKYSCLEDQCQFDLVKSKTIDELIKNTYQKITIKP